jgi:hypothetical protein
VKSVCLTKYLAMKMYPVLKSHRKKRERKLPWRQATLSVWFLGGGRPPISIVLQLVLLTNSECGHIHGWGFWHFQEFLLQECVLNFIWETEGKIPFPRPRRGKVGSTKWIALKEIGREAVHWIQLQDGVLCLLVE